MPIRDQYRVCLDPTARLLLVQRLAALPLIVQLSSERACQAVRQDCSFAKKRQSPLRSWLSSEGGASR